MNVSFFKSVFKGAGVGICVIALVAFITSLALLLVSDATPMVRACALAADFAGGLGAGIAASAFNKQKPLPTALSAGLIVCIILFVTSVIFDYGGNAWIAIGLIMAGALIAALVPAFSIKTNNQRRLGTAKHLSKRSVH